ncbi:hypothetical protein M9H77_07377 [Catharanthus roseus]|uniref:Uncharacterized protein n=1 Tax=Catharanthus roseus TaxID=4058 RepID=A0ACC0BV01_CATRO|nr:hypothetical protein M9H77_07377 [Catharanthus roseus]
MIKYWENLEYKAFCEQNKRNKNEGWGGGWGRRAGKHIDSSIFITEHQLKRQVDLTERFSKSKHLEELKKHYTGDKKGQRNFTRLDKRLRRKLQPRALLCLMISNE